MASSRKPGPSKASAGRVEVALAASLERTGARGSAICVALSGGVDSVVLIQGLASIAKRFGLSISALHVNHGLSPSAYKWERHCRTLCRRLRVPLTVRRVKIPTRRKGGLESAARDARYAALARARADFVALAHQLDDQAETVLMNLLRGAGLRGAAAMPETGPLPMAGETTLRALRPLLAVSREAVVEYAIAHRLHWDEDESNADQSLTRNWVRRSVGPLLASRYPRWREALARAAVHFGEAQRLLAADAAECLSAETLRTAPKARARLMLREFLRAGGVRAPDAKRLDEMLRQVLETSSSAGLEIALDGKIMGRFRGELAVLPDSATQGKVVFHSCKGAGIDAARFKAQPVTIRSRQGGERMRLAPNRPSRTLKNLFQEAGIPPWERDRLPLVYFGADLVWVPGLGVAADYRAARGKAGVMPEWNRGN